MPEFQDEVRHVSGEAVGVVIAKYTLNDIEFLDVRTDEKIIYETPNANWETIVPVDE